jgi:hypothetical protein
MKAGNNNVRERRAVDPCLFIHILYYPYPFEAP